MSEFVKSGNIIVPKPEGLDFDLKNGQIYRLKTERSFYGKKTFLEQDGTIEIPENIYKSKDEKFFIERSIKYYNESGANTTGLMLYGEQGCGKTMFAKVIAKEMNLPIIIIDPTFPTRDLIDFFTKFKTPVTILFDELDKHCDPNEDNWDTKQMLEFLDGVQTTCKKLVIFTCNKDEIVNEFLKNRCGRIRYYKHFTKLSKDSIQDIVNTELKDCKDKIDETVEAIMTLVDLPSYDNVISICKEVKDWPDYVVADLLTDLNVKLK